MSAAQLQECIRLCWDCRHICQKTLFKHCLPIGGVHMDEPYVKAAIDCIQICQVAADFMTRESAYHMLVCAVCADICTACAKACEQIGDETMMKCAEACRACARSCREMGKMREAA
jgi:hypothetical protein